MRKEIFTIVMSRLSEEPFFQNYKFQDKTKTFRWKTDEWYQYIRFERTKDTTHQYIKVAFYKQFYNLNEWFERFTQLPQEVFIKLPQVYAVGNVCNPENGFRFSLDGSDFETRYAELRDSVINFAENFYSRYATLETMYNADVAPLLTTVYPIFQSGIEWIFCYLSLAKIVRPESYYPLKIILLRHIGEQLQNGNPEISDYAKNLTEMFRFIEREDFLLFRPYGWDMRKVDAYKISREIMRINKNPLVRSYTIKPPNLTLEFYGDFEYLQNTNPDGRIKGLRFEDKDGNEVFPTVRIEGRRIVMDSEENLALRCVRAKYCMGRKAEKYGSLCTDEGYTVIPFNIYV